MPSELDDAELIKLVDEAILKTGASVLADMGKVIGIVMASANGKADGSKVAQLVKNKLNVQ